MWSNALQVCVITNHERNWHLLCVEAIYVQYSHLFDYRAFPGFTGPWKQKENRNDKSDNVDLDLCSNQKTARSTWNLRTMVRRWIPGPGWRWRSRATSSVWSITDLNLRDLFLRSASTPRTLSTITNPSFRLHHRTQLSRAWWWDFETANQRAR